MNYVNADCSSGEVPEVRIVTPPANDDVSLKRQTMPIARSVNDPLNRCNGKPVEAVTVFYKLKDGFTGADTVVLDVDFRHGKVSRFIYNIAVR